MIISSLTIVVTKAEIEKPTAITPVLIHANITIINGKVRLYNIRLAFHCTFVARLLYKIP